MRFPAPLPFLSLILALALAGCASSDHRGPEGARTMAPPIAPLAGEAGFRDGKIVATVTLGAAPRPRPSSASVSGQGGESADDRARRPVPVSGDGMRPRGERREGIDPAAARAARQALGGNQPPARVILRLENRGTETIEMRVAAFDSVLGNFAVRPERVSITPGESVEVDPMISRLGVNRTEIPVTITLVSDGRGETQIATLRPVAPSAP